jgi:predicted phage terminase large subunit-like protein
LADNIRQLANERRVLVPLYTLDNRVNKLVRIRRLTPLLSQGRLRFKGDSPGARLLVEQLRDFPNGDHDDGPDALEMAVRLAAELLSRTDDDVETILVAV